MTAPQTKFSWLTAHAKIVILAMAKPAPVTSALRTQITWTATAKPGHQPSAGKTGASAI
jgi:hypothetical protein